MRGQLSAASDIVNENSVLAHLEGTAFGTSPHRFQVGRRLARAQEMIAAGVPLSEAAAATGFADQSHLTRHFSARFGVTPGRWAALARAHHTGD